VEGLAGAHSITFVVKELPPRVAVIPLTAETGIAPTLAVKVVVAKPAGATTKFGIARSWLVLRSVTAAPPVGAAALSVTVQVVEPFADSRPGAQLKEERVAETEGIATGG
jgi:hypothetical protein